MKNKLLLSIFCLSTAIAQSNIAVPPAKALSPAEKSILRAQEMIAKRPNSFEFYNVLAMAQARRARETSDVSYYAAAEKSLAKSFGFSPDNYEGLKIQTWLLLGRHEFAKARDAAQKLNAKVPDDVIVYGYLADANAELGNYEAAENAAQWMLNLRAGNIPGLTRGAYLRELFGDLDGAVEFMQLAYDATPTSELEDRAWLLTQMAHLQLETGDLKKAELAVTGALGLFPDYHYALGVLAQIRVAQKRYSEAADLFAKRYSRAPHAENLYAWAKALKMAGHEEEASAKFSEFERRSLAESGLADNSNHELVLFYTDDATKPAEALRIAQTEAARRHDVHTLDCLAWALHTNSQDNEALQKIEIALAVGVKDPEILYHAGAIHLALHDRKKGEDLLRDAAHRNSQNAERLLASLDSVSTSGTN